MPQHSVKWYQPSPELVNSWEFQYSDAEGSLWEDATVVGDATNCPDCFQTTIDVPVTATQVRSRAIGPTGISEWSSPIALGEPDILLALLSGVLFIAFAFGRTKCRRWF